MLISAWSSRTSGLDGYLLEFARQAWHLGVMEGSCSSWVVETSLEVWNTDEK